MSTDPRIDAYVAKAAPFAQPILKHLRALVTRRLERRLPNLNHPNHRPFVLSLSNDRFFFKQLHATHEVKDGALRLPAKAGAQESLRQAQHERGWVTLDDRCSSERSRSRSAARCRPGRAAAGLSSGCG